MTVVVRDGRPADAAAVARIHVGAWQHAYRGLVGDAVLDALDVDARTASWGEWIARSLRGDGTDGDVRHELLVAERDAEVVEVVKRHARNDRVEVPRLGEGLDRRPSEDVALGRLGIDRDDVVAGS